MKPCFSIGQTNSPCSILGDSSSNFFRMSELFDDIFKCFLLYEIISFMYRINTQLLHLIAIYLVLLHLGSEYLDGVVDPFLQSFNVLVYVDLVNHSLRLFNLLEETFSRFQHLISEQDSVSLEFRYFLERFEIGHP